MRSCANFKFNCACRKQPFHVQTYNTNCIEPNWVCDGEPDCEDESDEMNCICSQEEFQCSACTRGEGCTNQDIFPIFYCISREKVQNGLADCLNEKDEENNM